MADVISITRADTILTFPTVLEGFQNAKSGDVLTLLLDSDLSSTVVLKNVSIILDLAGHSITSNVGRSAFYLSNGAALEVKDTSELGSGVIKHTSQSGIYLSNTDSEAEVPEFTLTSGMIEAQEFGICIFGFGKVVVSGGKVLAHDNGAIGANGSAQYSSYPYTIDISGGDIVAETQTSGYANCGVYAANAGTVTVSGGKIQGVSGAGIVVRAGDLIVSGGEILGCGTTSGLKMGDSSPTFCGGVEICNSANYPGKMGKCYISGGTISSNHSAGLLVIGDPSDYPNAGNSKIVVSDGTFAGSSDAVDFVDSTGSKLPDASDANLVVLGGSFNSDISKFLDSSIKLTKVVDESGNVIYAVKDDTGDILKATENIQSSVSSIYDTSVEAIAHLNSLETLTNSIKSDNDEIVKVNNKILESIEKSSPIDPDSIIDGSSPASVDDLYLTSLKHLIANGILFEEKYVIWQHPMVDAVRDFCEQKGYEISRFISINPPAKLGDQWLIKIAK